MLEGNFSEQFFEYAFLDQDFNSQYKRMMKKVRFYDILGLTVFIACLGLLRLSAFTTEQRTKEIGVKGDRCK
jgi:putative ABC transport system permease protein